MSHCTTSEAIALTQAKQGHDTLSKTARGNKQSLPAYVVSIQQTNRVESRSSPTVLDLRASVPIEAEHCLESPDDSPPTKPPRWVAAALRGTQPPLSASERM
jgi:hypothetical protein